MELRKPRQRDASLPGGNAGDILLVEDDPTDAELTTRALEAAGLVDRLVHASDGEEALDCIFAPKHAPSVPKLILLDLNLRKMGGLHVLRKLKSDERTRGVPVVVLTSSRIEIELLESYKLGANSYVIKPSDGKKFAEVVAAVGHYWLAINEAPPSTRLGPRPT